MKKFFLLITITLTFLFNCFSQNELNVTEIKIKELSNDDTQLNSKDVNFFSNKKIIKKIITKLNQIFSNNTYKPYEQKQNEYVLNCFLDNNFKIINIIELDNNKIFINYLCPKEYQRSQSFIFLTYNKKSKEIENIQFANSNYTPIVFHKYSYNNKSILYAIANNSSSGTAVTDYYLITISPDKLDLYFSECILFSARFFSKGVEDISFNKDFIFENDTIHIYGKDYNFDKQKYLDYDKTYKLP